MEASSKKNGYGIQRPYPLRVRVRVGITVYTNLCGIPINSRFPVIAGCMSHDNEVKPPPIFLKRTQAEYRHRGFNVITDSDATSRPTAWGSFVAMANSL